MASLMLVDFVTSPPSGLSVISSAGDYYMEITETGSGGQNNTIRKKTELTVREELQKETNEWLVGAV